MGDHETQSWPLAPAKIHQRSDDEENPAFKILRKERTSKCFVYAFSFLILSLTVFLIFSLVALRAKPPAVKLRAVHVTRLRYTANSFNLTLVADVSIRNPNFGPFRYEANNSAAVFYGGGKVGETRFSGGNVKVRATKNVKVTLDLRSSFLPEGKNYLERDLGLGMLNLTSFSRFGGRVHMLGALKTRKTTEMSCQMTLVLKTRQIKNLIC